MQAYPVDFDATPPTHYDRSQVLVRVLMLFVLGALGGSLGWMYLVLYLALPMLAAAALGGRASSTYLATAAPRLVLAIRWIIALYAYLGFLTDEFPAPETNANWHLEITPQGEPTTGSALARLLASLPGFLLGALSGFIAVLAAMVAAVYVLIDRRVPVAIFRFERGVVRSQARLLAYHASIVDLPPPLVFDGSSHTRDATAG